MRNNLATEILLLIIAAAFIAGCSNEMSNQDLYLYEELETASAREDPQERIERLKLFISDHGDHPSRLIAYGRIMNAMATDLKDMDSFQSYCDDIIGKEDDGAARGDILYRKFSILWDADREKAIEFAQEIVKGPERDYKLHLYFCYYLMYEEGQESLTEDSFAKLLSIETDPYRAGHARAVYGEFLFRQDRKDEGYEVLKEAGRYPFAGEMTGAYLWEEGKKEEAIDAYLDYAAGVPGGGEHIRIDSLYSVVYPDRDDLHSQIMERRMIDGGVVPDMDFSDLKGKTHRLSAYRGRKLVISAWSPT